MMRCLNEQDSRCIYCRRVILPRVCRKAVMAAVQKNLTHLFRDIRVATIEHRVPVANGGTNTGGNVVAACEECNNERSWMGDRKQINLRASVDNANCGEPDA